MTNPPEQKEALFHFYGELNDFLAPWQRNQPIPLAFRGAQTVKHLFESLGVPHTEVGRLYAGRREVDFSYQVAQGDEMHIYPYAIPLDLPNSVWLSRNEPAGFVVDNHLGRLAAYLRMLGFDSVYRSDIQDDELAEVAEREERILLTRDHRLLMRNSIRYGYWVRSKLPRQQLGEILRRWNLPPLCRPFRRCIRCNGLLEAVEKEQIVHRLQPLTRLYFEEFRICPDCQQVYWKGSHYERMQTMIAALRVQS